MDNIYTLLIFLIVLFFYFHITYQYKTSNSLEIYEIEDNVSKKRFEDILNMRQPVLFTFNNEYLFNISNTFLETNFLNNDIFIRNCNDIDSFYVPEKYSNFIKLSKSEVNYISEYNSESLINSSLIKYINQCDGNLRPYMMLNSNYDLITGNKNAYTPLKYEFYNRNFLLVLDGKVKIKCIPPMYTNDLKFDFDAEHLNYVSFENPWKSENTSIKYLDVEIAKGQIIYIPPYWSYSVFISENRSIVTSFKYGTYMSNISSLNVYLLSLLQKLNTKYKIAKTFDNLKETYKKENTTPPVNITNDNSTKDIVNEAKDEVKKELNNQEKNKIAHKNTAVNNDTEIVKPTKNN